VSEAMNESLATVLLAGGQSTRMGQDKSGLYAAPLKQTLLEYGLQKLGHLSSNTPLLSSNINASGIPDRFPLRGPLAGIHATLLHVENMLAHCTELLVVPVDMPNLSVDLLRSLLQFGRHNQCASYLNQQYLPLYLPISSKLTASLTAQLSDSQDWSLRRLTANLGAQSLNLKQDNSLLNINHPAEWRQFCATLQISEQAI
jgi:molybdenum cofactor guanylyltransferase